jgi:hypothetical protein
MPDFREEPFCGHVRLNTSSAIHSETGHALTHCALFDRKVPGRSFFMGGKIIV